MTDSFLHAERVSRRFPVRRGVLRRVRAWVRAVEPTSISIDRGEVVGLVGESGCGKTTLGRMLGRLVRPTDGSVLLEGRDVWRARGAALRAVRRSVQTVFQNPWSSLNPRMSAGELIGEGLRVHHGLRGSELHRRVCALLADVGLPESAAGQFPHEFSGGQRQRIGLVRALAVEPRLVICDEPVAALDVSLRAHVLELIEARRRQQGTAFLFISHDLAVVRQVADRVMVMYLGELVEEGPVEVVFGAPQHPYTRSLVAAAPTIPPLSVRSVLPLGEVPSAMDPPAGCRFHPRCPDVLNCCRTESAAWRTHQDPTHRSRCHLELS